MAHAGSGAEWNARWLDGDTPWDKGGSHPALLAWLEKNPSPGRVLVPGCGAGHDVRAIAARGLEVVGFDIAAAAIAAAETFPKTGKETYRLGDLFALPPDLVNDFNTVFEHTCFCAISPALRCSYVEAVAAALKPKGCLLGIFYINPGHENDGPPYGCPVKELDSLFAKKFRLLEEYFPIATFLGRENRERMRLYELA